MAKQNITYAYLDQLSTEQLEDLLRTDLTVQDQSNEEVVFRILEILEQREREQPTGRLPDAGQGWAEFQQYYNIPEGEGVSLYSGGPPVEENPPSVLWMRVRQGIKACATAAAIFLVICGGILAGEICGFEPITALGLWPEGTHISTLELTHQGIFSQGMMMYMLK